MNLTTGNYSNMVNYAIKCTYDAGKGEFLMEGDNWKSKASGLKGKKMFPFVVLYAVDNEATIAIL